MKKSNDIHFVPPCHFRLGSVPLQTLCQPVLASHKRDSEELVLRCLKYLRLREEIHCNSQKLRFGVSMFCQTMAHNGLLSSCMYSLQAALKYLVNLNAAKMQLMTIVPPALLPNQVRSHDLRGFGKESASAARRALCLFQPHVDNKSPKLYQKTFNYSSDSHLEPASTHVVMHTNKDLERM